MVTALPTNVSYGTVTGRFLLAYADGSDLDPNPDGVAAKGTVLFTPSPNFVKNASAAPAPVTILPATIECVLDSDGYLLGTDGTRGVRLVATDDTDNNPVDWTWKVTFRLTDQSDTPTRGIPDFSFELPGDTTVDLTTVMPVPDANGTYYLVGPVGPAGPANNLSIGTVTTGAAGSNASASITGTSPNQSLSLTIPRGNTGATGSAATIAVGTVTTGAAGSSATVTNSGTSSAATFDFTIPRGNTGATGPANTLSVGTVTTGNPGTNAAIVITGSAPNQTVNFTIPRGDVGQPNSLAIGTVTTGLPTDPAAASITGTAPSQTLSLTIPQGIQGIQGPPGNLGNLQATSPIVYNSTTSTISFDPSGYTFTGQALGSPVRNQTGINLTKGQVVYMSGTDGNNALISLSKADAESTSSKTAGLLLGDLGNNNNGYIVTQGLLTNVNTAGLTEGAAVYLSPSVAGGMTSTKPYAPNHLVTVGFCVRAHATAGQIYVRIANGFELDEIHDVAIGTKNDGEAVVYEASTGLWKNKAVAWSTISSKPSTFAPSAHTHAIADLTDFQISGALTGDYLVYNGTKWINQTQVTPGLEATFMMMGA